jgi:hypothetical protein
MSANRAYGAVTVPFRVQTYKNMAYLALAFPLGLAYFVGFTVGASLGIGLSVTIIGIPILLATIAAATVVAGFEAQLASYLTEVDASVPSFLGEFSAREEVSLPGDGFVDSVKRLLTAPSTWTSVLLILTKFVFGIVSFVALVFTTALSSAMVLAPFFYDAPSGSYNVMGKTTVAEYSMGPWTIDTLPEAVGLAAGGVVFLIVALNVLNIIAKAQAKYTATMLRSSET